MNEIFKKIVVATDGTDFVNKAIDSALDIAELTGGTIHAVYVTDVASVTPTSPEWTLVAENMKSESEKALAYVKANAAERNVSCETVALEGSPANEIIRYAKEIDADLIVVGATGKKAVERFLLGSVSEKIVRNATVPVLVVRLTL